MEVNRIYLTDAKAGLAQLDANSVNMVFTSPPYALQRPTYDGVSADEYPEWFMQFIPDLQRTLVDNGSFFLNIKEHSVGGIRETYVLELVLRIIKESEFKLIDTFCWTKNGFPRIVKNSFKNSWEAIYHFAKQPNIKIRPERVMVDISKQTLRRLRYKPSGESETKSGFVQPNFKNYEGKKKSYPGNHLHINNIVNQFTRRRFHPATFPKKLVEFFVLAFTDEGDLVLDPFIGSGTTALVAKDLNRNYIGFDNKKEYIEKIGEILGLEVQLPMEIEELKNKLLVAWSKETAKGYWDKRCPELNQCAVTALIVQDCFGGELLRCKTSYGDSHYWNRLPDGTEVDLTFEQFKFSGDEPYKDDYVIRDREYVLSFPDTVKRYELLKSRL